MLGMKKKREVSVPAHTHAQIHTQTQYTQDLCVIREVFGNVAVSEGVRRRFGKRLGSFWDEFGDVLGVVWGCFGTCFAICWSVLGDVLPRVWGGFEACLGTF